MRGEKGEPHLDPEDPPRRRANKKRGHGTYERDRPPLVQLICRESKELRICLVHNANRKNLEALIIQHLPIGAELRVNTDEWRSYGQITRFGLIHQTVNHSIREWARDDDGDGIREVHVNSCEGSGTGLRNFLRRFRGVHKTYLDQYCASFQLMFNAKKISPQILRTMMGINLSHTNRR